MMTNRAHGLGFALPTILVALAALQACVHEPVTASLLPSHRPSDGEMAFISTDALTAIDHRPTAAEEAGFPSECRFADHPTAGDGSLAAPYLGFGSARQANTFAWAYCGETRRYQLSSQQIGSNAAWVARVHCTRQQRPDVFIDTMQWIYVDDPCAGLLR